jgi:DtxR family Mn-dependent transcriptional regulator
MGGPPWKVVRLFAPAVPFDSSTLPQLAPNHKAASPTTRPREKVALSRFPIELFSALRSIKFVLYSFVFLNNLKLVLDCQDVKAREKIAMPTLVVENYLKTILMLESSSPGDGRKPIVTGKIAATLKVAPGTVTAMIKALGSAGLVRYRRYQGIRLTSKGRAAALNVLRRHRLVELFLVEVLGMNWTEVHEEAETLEHAISARVLERLDSLLGHPTVDPHGDPIPQATGRLPPRSLVSLRESITGDRCVVARLVDQSPEFLKMAERHDLRPGTSIQVRNRDDSSGVLHLLVNGKEVSVSTAVASRIEVAGLARKERASQKRRRISRKKA